MAALEVLEAAVAEVEQLDLSLKNFSFIKISEIYLFPRVIAKPL